MSNLVCTHTEYRQTTADGGSPNNTLPSSIERDISLLKAHHHKPRGAQEHNGGQEPKLGTQRKGHMIWSFARAVPEQPQAQCPGVKPNMIRKFESTFWTMWGSLPGGMGVGHIMGCSFGLHKTYYAMLREEPKVGKGIQWLREEQVGENRGLRG